MSKLKIFATISACLLSSLVYALTQPKFTIVPVIANANVVQIASNSTTTVVFQVTNNTKITRTLTVVPIPGISQQSTGPGSCANPFTLSHKQSCLLTFLLTGSQLPSRVTEGPVICKTQGPGNNSPDNFLCSQPSAANSWNITVVPSEAEKKYTIGGTIAGLSTSGLVLQNNGGDNLSVAANATSFQFTTTLDTGSSYNVTIDTQPSNLTCVVNNGSGTVTGNVSNISITCVENFAFIANLGNSNIQSCNINASTGTFSGCASAVSGVNPIGLATNPANTFFYITAISSSEVYKCSFNRSTGTISGCVPSGAGASVNAPFGMVINASNTYAYIANNGGSTITQCDVNNATGLLLNCNSSNLSGAISSPNEIIINSAGTYAYITNTGSDTVSQCNINPSTGVLSACINSNPSGLFNNPAGIAFNSDNTSAYIVNNVNPGSIIRCSINSSSGALENCVNANASSLTLSFDIALNAANTYAYITNTSGGSIRVTQCTINASTGLFSSCQSAGATGLSFPSGIILR